ncbi:heterogeneous nuclear ribonucleoproteins A2/B1-like, partial [Argonauta hians]
MAVNTTAKKYRKLFVGGLSRETNEISLKTYFEQWGEVVDCVVVRNPATGSSKGFSFLVFKEASTLDDIQFSRPHILDNRCVETRRAMPYYKNPGELRNIMEVYVGRFRKEVCEKDILDAFSTYGTVKKLEWVISNTGKYTGFVFLCFDDIDSVDKCVLHSKVRINGRQVVATRATRNKCSTSRTPERTTALPSSFLQPSYAFTHYNPTSNGNAEDKSDSSFQYHLPQSENNAPDKENMETNRSFPPEFYPRNFPYLTPQIPFVAAPFRYSNNPGYKAEQNEFSL